MEATQKKNRLFILLFALLCLPLVRQCIPVAGGKLHGYYEAKKHLPFTWRGWWDGNYQTSEDDFVNDSMGFRKLFVNINNEMDFRFFKKAHAKNVVFGKDNYLYEQIYIDEYFGRGFTGDDMARNKLAKLKKIQDTLARQGKTLCVVYAPSKAYYYPQYIPEKLQGEATTQSYYHSFTRIGDSLGLKYMDCNGWFVQMRGGPNLLFSRAGIHWTEYGALICMDSVARYIDKARNIDMPQGVWTKIERTTRPHDQEWDLEAALNLLLPVSHDVLSHPEVTYTHDTDNSKPSIIFIGDSFLWTIVGNHVASHMSNNWEFWYYFNEVYNENVITGKEPMHSISSYNWQKQLVSKDVVVLMYTTAGLSNFGNDFIEQAGQYFGYK